MSHQIDKMTPSPSASTVVAKPIRKPSVPVAAHDQQSSNLNQPLETAPRLGHSFGNIGVHYGSSPIIQPKLTIGPANDSYEQEADRVAAQVVNQVNAPTTQRQGKPEDEEKVQTKPAISSLQRQDVPEEEEKMQTKPGAVALQRQEEPEKEEEVQTKPLVSSLQRQAEPEDEEKVQTKPLLQPVQRQEEKEEDKLQTKSQLQRQADGTMAATPALESAIAGLRGSGQSLPDSTRQPLEQAFGADFSKVKVHTDAQADQLNRSIQARAFTTGQDIFFRQGEHSPGAQAGQDLLAHELTHIVQQNPEVAP